MEFFGTLSPEWAIECMKDLLMVNLRGNLQIIVQVGFALPTQLRNFRRQEKGKRNVKYFVTPIFIILAFLYALYVTFNCICM